MHIYISTYIHTYTHTYTHTYIHTYILHAYTHSSTRKYIAQQGFSFCRDRQCLQNCDQFRKTAKVPRLSSDVTVPLIPEDGTAKDRTPGAGIFRMSHVQLCDVSSSSQSVLSGCGRAARSSQLRVNNSDGQTLMDWIIEMDRHRHVTWTDQTNMERHTYIIWTGTDTTGEPAQIFSDGPAQH